MLLLIIISAYSSVIQSIPEKQQSSIYVSHAEYGVNEWVDEGWLFIGPQKSDSDFVSVYYDWGPINSGRAIGIKVIQRALSWRDGFASHIIAYEFDVIYDKSHSDIGAPEELDSFYFGIKFDADVSEVDPLDPHIDDLVCYDGWTGGEWLSLTHFPSPSDNFTILQDTALNIPDGVPDQICLFGDDPNELTILGDTQIVWRNMSFIFDGDNPDEPGNDSTESDSAAGYIFASMLYAPESPNDSIWIDTVMDTCRLARPATHQWWDWNHDPGTDSTRFAYMTGTHPFSQGYKFMPHPFDMDTSVFDYRFLLTYGPYSIADGDTLRFVLATGVGQGLNGGVDTVYNRSYLPGARQLCDYALMMYYDGSTSSDPYHPSDPKEDIHWNYTGLKGYSGKAYEFMFVNTGDLWTTVSNYGQFGDPNADMTGNPSYDWPGIAGYYYLFHGGLWVGTNQGVGSVEETTFRNEILLINSVIVDEIVSLTIQLNEKKSFEINIYDQCGRLIKQINDCYGVGKNILLIPLDALSSGIYFVRGKIERDVVLQEKIILFK